MQALQPILLTSPLSKVEIRTLYEETILLSGTIMGFGVAQAWVQTLSLHLLVRDVGQDT